MLWKYKKVYQETSKDIVNPPVEACTRLINISGTFREDGASRLLEIEYILCGDDTNTVIETTLQAVGTETVILTINQCIKVGSLFLNGVNITDETEQTLPDFIVQVDFEDCEDPCSETEEIASVINNIVYNNINSSAGYLVDCVLNSYCFLQYTEDGTTWITYPTLYPSGANNFFVSLNNDKLKFRFISRCEDILSNEFEIEAITCVYLDSISGIYTGSEGDSTEIYIEYTPCNGSAVGVFMYTGMTSLSIGACIVEGSVYAGGTQIQVTPTLAPSWTLNLNTSEC
jgi:hypothetical protein